MTTCKALSDEERQALAWLDQTATTSDTILLNVRRLVASSEQLLPFHLRVTRRAHHQALSSVNHYSSPRIRREASLARQRAAVAERADSDRNDDSQPITETL